MSLEMTAGLAAAYAGLITMAVVPIYVGSKMSLRQRFKEDGDEDTIVVEAMTSEDAYMFPIVGSGVLLGLYVLFKLVGKDYINMLLAVYFSFLGTLAITTVVRHYLLPYMSKAQKETKEHSIPFPYFGPIQFEWSTTHSIALVPALLVSVGYGLTKNWIANNIIAYCFAIEGIALISLGTYRNSVLLLSGLFLYDIFWVFGTDVMLTVAKSFDGPIKVVFPKDIFSALPWKYSLLGLGDIVIPGIYIALMLRFDAKLFGKKVDTYHPYFTASYVAYILGLLVTFAVMHTFQAGQPALLYLVPFCIASSLLVAVSRGELSSLWAFDEEDGQVVDSKKNK